MTSAEFQSVVKTVPADFAAPEMDYRAVRAMMAPFHGHPLRDTTEMEIASMGGVDCGIYRRRDGAVQPGYALHFHGGALVSCPLSVYHFYAEWILDEVGRQTFMPDYRLAPEHPYPAAIDDCLAVYRAILDSGVDPGQIIVFGESCGAGLGLCALLRARDQGLPMPAGFVSLTGWFDLSMSGAARVPDPFLTPEWVRNRGREFTNGAVALDDPAVSPCYADLTGMPPLFLQVGQYDTAAPGALELARRATLAGVRVQLESWPGMTQGWHGLLGSGVPEAKAAWARIRTFVDVQLAG